MIMVGRGTSPATNLEFMNVHKTLSATAFGLYAALVVVGTVSLYEGASLFFQSNRMIQIEASTLGLILLGFSFMIALLAYNKFRFYLKIPGAVEI
jgi:energy-converting hydrogenase Eha subunit E